MTSQGRQHPDGPILPPPGVKFARLPEGLEAGSSADFWPDAAGEIMASLLGAPEQPGPPYVHTFVPPEPIGTDEDGNDIYPEPGPAWTLTEGG